MAGSLSYQGQNLENLASGQNQTLFGQSQGIQSTLLPYFQNQMTNPQGLGATNIQQMLTQGGQGVASGVGAARQTATDMAGRTGNTAAIPGIVGSAAKAGMVQQSNLANKLSTQNVMEKLQQQQSGAAGLSGLYGTNLKESMTAGSNANAALEAAIKAKQVQDAEKQSIFKDVAGAGLMIGGAMTGNPAIVEAGAKTI